MKKLKLGIMISGRGSNMRAIIEACRLPDFPAEVAMVVSNKGDAAGLILAHNCSIETRHVDAKKFADKDSYEAEITSLFSDMGVDLICLAGYMRILGDGFVSHWQGKLINIHPSLLPKYKGLDTHQRALDSGDAEAGCTVHYVVPELDSGEIIAQTSVPIEDGETVDSLRQKVLTAEHKLYPAAIKMIAEAL